MTVARPRADAAALLLNDLFARVVQDHAAVVAVDVPPGAGRARRQCRYDELAAMAQRFAAAVAGHGQGERFVALLLPRAGPELYAAMLGVQAAGAAWLGLDAAHPDEHLAAVLGDAGPVLAISDAVGCERLRRLAPNLPVVEVAEVLTVAPAAPLPRPDSDHRLAYVIYTSGTTGRPKGVLVEHRSIVNLVASDLAEFGLGPGDRVAQNSSCAYDSAVEEIWLALAAGATLVPLDDEVVRLGPDLPAWLAAERITVLCPPPTLLRAMGPIDPAKELPHLRLVYAGGEALPADLVDRWAPGRRFVNGYGPTECTVTVVRTDVTAGQPVAIGWPVPGNRALVLDESLREVGDGEVGELCLAGVGLARGYLRRPELTAAVFVAHPEHGRIYRTGDMVRRRDDGALLYEGRRDAQVKVRGHRIELGSVESQLVALPGVRAAAAVVQDDALVAFVVPADPHVPPDPVALRAALAATSLPAAVPSAIACLETLPTTIGGKLDRRQLPRLAAAGGVGTSRAPHGVDENALAAAFAAVLRVADLGAEDDFFALGGNSIRAAELVTRLRAAPRFASIAVRDVYQQRTVAGLARLPVASAVARPPLAAADGALPGRAWPRLVTALQGVWLLGELVVAAWCVAALVLPWLQDLLAGTTEVWMWLLVPLAWSALPWVLLPVTLVLAVVGKRALVGRYRAGRVPAFGWFHLRHWCVLRLVRLLPWGAVQGTALERFLLRALGARIGPAVHLEPGVDLRQGGWDLLTLEAGAAIGRDAELRLVERRAGELVFGPVHVGREATLAVRAGLPPDSHLGDGAVLGPLATVVAGTRVPAGERWTGVPASCSGAPPAPRQPTPAGAPLSPLAQLLLVLCCRGLGGFVVQLPWLGLVLLAAAWAGVDAAAVAAWLAGDPAAGSWPFLCLALLLYVPSKTVAQALLLRWLPAVPAGVLPADGLWHRYAMWRSEVVEAAGEWWSGSVFWPPWLRLAGARLGRRAELSTITGVLPEQLAIGSDGFLADGIYLGTPHVERGTVEIAPTSLGDRTFLGNHVVVPPGTAVGSDLLLGVATLARGRGQPDGTAWFGLPDFELPRREVVAADRRLTFAPGLLQWLSRGCWETLRIAVPLLPAAAAGAFCALLPVLGSTALPPWLAAAAAAALAAALPPAVVLAAKWLLLGRVRPGQHGLWSCWCSRWDFLYVLWGHAAKPVLEALAGTLWLNLYLRAIGMRLGRAVQLGPGFAQVVDPDMLEIGDGAAVDAMFQAHSFEDRVLKTDVVRVGAGATLGPGTVVLYGAEIGPGTAVLAHSVVMKHERLLPGRRYAGAPTRCDGPAG